MQPFTTVRGPAALLPIANLNTDVIIRIERLTALERDQLGPYALEALRYRPDGSEEPGFILNQPPFRAATILLGGSNFGCGSSREAAVWALMARGVRCVIAPSFGDIFLNNAFENGLLPVRLEQGAIDRLATFAQGGAPLEVDLAAQRIRAGAEEMPFEVDVQRKHAMLRGLDAIGLTLLAAERIRAWQVADRQRRPWAWPAAAAGDKNISLET
jgi:3-isopropylmalate/(R)-2-methylmalate dehydratase small subunit